MVSVDIVFIVKIFQKYILLDQLKSRANFEWRVPLMVSWTMFCLHVESLHAVADVSFSMVPAITRLLEKFVTKIYE